MKIALVIMTLVTALAFSLRVGDGWYEHNDGVTIACSLEPLSKLLHPGDMSIKGCSFDHQPLYLIFVKFTSSLSNYKLVFYQACNVLFMLVGWLFLSLNLLKRVHWSLALSLPFFFLTSFNTLHWIQELRMYALFIGTSSVLIGEFFRSQENEKASKFSLFNHVVGYFNYFMYCLPFLAYLTYNLKRWGKWDRKLKIVTLTLLICLLIKIPFVFWWRFQSRRGGLDLGWDHIWQVFFVELFKGTTPYKVAAWFLLLSAITWQLMSLKKRLSSRWYLAIIIVSYAMMICCTFLKMHEIELRYLLFLYPLFAVMVAEALEQMPIKVKYLVSFICILTGLYNAFEMRIRGHSDGGEIRQSAEAYTRLTESEDLEVWTDEPYWFFNYVGVYSFVQTGKQNELHYLDSTRVQDLPVDHNLLFVTVLKTDEEHDQLVSKFKGEKHKTWSEKNLLGSKTIMTKITNSHTP